MTKPKPKPKSVEIPAAEANRRFSELLRGVKEEGKTFTITSHGRPVAKISAPDTEAQDEAAMQAQRKRAWAEFMSYLEAKPILNLPKFTRDDFYG